MVLRSFYGLSTDWTGSAAATLRITWLVTERFLLQQPRIQQWRNWVMQVAAPAAGSIQSHSGGRQPGQEGAEQGLRAVAWSTHGGRPAAGQTDKGREMRSAWRRMLSVRMLPVHTVYCTRRRVYLIVIITIISSFSSRKPIERIHFCLPCLIDQSSTAAETCKRRLKSQL